MRYLDLDREHQRRRIHRTRRANLLIGGFIILVIFLSLGLFLCREGLLAAIFRPISIVSQLVSRVPLQETEGRTNVLVLGLDSRSTGSTLNTDTILVGSFSSDGNNPTLISIPRDLWVRSDSIGKGWQKKINTAYSNAAFVWGKDEYGKPIVVGFDEEKGIAGAEAVVEEVLGIPIHYWVIVDFTGFKEIIDTLKGIEVCVEHTFDDNSYPIPGKEAAIPLSARYEHLHFDAGCQTMDGETALKYSRSRMGTAGEGSDFARVRRQQKVILAVKDKIMSLSLLFNPGKVAALYRQFTGTIRTNVSLGEAQRALELLYKFDDEMENVESLVLDPQSGLTYHPPESSTGGAYVLLPKGGNFSAIHAAVQDLFSGAAAEEAISE